MDRESPNRGRSLLRCAVALAVALVMVPGCSESDGSPPPGTPSTEGRASAQSSHRAAALAELRDQGWVEHRGPDGDWSILRPAEWLVNPLGASVWLSVPNVDPAEEAVLVAVVSRLPLGGVDTDSVCADVFEVHVTTRYEAAETEATETGWVDRDLDGERSPFDLTTFALQVDFVLADPMGSSTTETLYYLCSPDQVSPSHAWIVNTTGAEHIPGNEWLIEWLRAVAFSLEAGIGA